MKLTKQATILVIFSDYWFRVFSDPITVSPSPKNLGAIASGTQAKIVDPDTEEILGPNQIGEIYAKCDLVMKGYLNRPEEDKKFFAPDGFIRTGDLGHYDDNGTMYFDGRNKDLIKVWYIISLLLICFYHDLCISF